MSSSEPHVRRAFALLLLLAASATAPAAYADPPAPAPSPAAEPAPPPGTHPVRRVRRALVAGGASLFAIPYLASAAVAADGYSDATASMSDRGALWIPVVGPFVMMGRTSSAGYDALLVLDGLAQAAGISLFVYGLATPVTVLEPDEAKPAATIRLAPVVAKGMSGAVLAGTF